MYVTTYLTVYVAMYVTVYVAIATGDKDQYSKNPS